MMLKFGRVNLQNTWGVVIDSKLNANCQILQELQNRAAHIITDN